MPRLKEGNSARPGLRQARRNSKSIQNETFAASTERVEREYTGTYCEQFFRL